MASTKKYLQMNKEQLLDVIEQKNKTISSLNGKVYYNSEMKEYFKKEHKKSKKKIEGLVDEYECFIEYIRVHLTCLLVNATTEKQRIKLNQLIKEIDNFFYKKRD